MSVPLQDGQQVPPLNSLLAAHKLTCGQSGQWTHRDASCGSLYRFERGSNGEQQLLHYMPDLATSYGSARATLLTLVAKAPSLPEQLLEYIAHSGHLHAAESGRVPRSSFLHGFRCWSRDWDTPSRRVASTMTELGFPTYRSHGVRYWVGLQSTH